MLYYCYYIERNMTVRIDASSDIEIRTYSCNLYSSHCEECTESEYDEVLSKVISNILNHKKDITLKK